MSVTPNTYALHVKENTDKIGVNKRAELNEKTSRSAYTLSNPWDAQYLRGKIARIYQS